MIYIWTKQWSAYLWPEHWKEISYNGESVTQHSVNYAGCSSSQTGVNVERRWSAAVSTLASGWWHSLVDTVFYCSTEVWLGPRTTTEAALGTSGWPGWGISNASPHLRFPLHPGRHLPHLWVLLIHAWGSQSSTPEFRSWNSTYCLQRALASLGWVSLVDWHPHPSTFLAKLLPREAHSMPSTSPAFLSCSADLPGDISQRHLFFLLTEEFGLPGSPWQASPPSLFSCSPRLPLSFLAAGQRGKLARHRGSRGKGTSPGSWIKVRRENHNMVIKVQPPVGPGKSWAMVLASFHWWRFHTPDRRTWETSKAVCLLLVKDERSQWPWVRSSQSVPTRVFLQLQWSSETWVTLSRAWVLFTKTQTDVKTQQIP